jgi:glucose 1-dehydrogenase
MMRSLAQEVAAERIRVNAIAPGAIRTPINRSAWETKEAAERLLTLIPYGRIGEPEDVARPDGYARRVRKVDCGVAGKR